MNFVLGSFHVDQVSLQSRKKERKKKQMKTAGNRMLCKLSDTDKPTIHAASDFYKRPSTLFESV